MYLLNTKQKLHLGSITILGYGSGIFISILAEYFKNGRLAYTSFERTELFILNPLLVATISTAFTFWLFLKTQKNQLDSSS